MRLLLVSSILALGFGALSPALAEEAVASRNGPAKSEDWKIDVGVVAAYVQDFPGASAQQLTPLPYFDIDYKGKYFLHATSGAGIYLYNEGNNFISTSLTYARGREEDEAGFLNGLGDIDNGIAARTAAQVDMTYFVLGGYVTHQVVGSDTGTEATVYATTRLGAAEGFRIYPTLLTTFVDDERNQAFFGITPEQAANTSFAQYTPEGGHKSYGVQLQGLYDFNKDWRIAGQVNWERLTGDAADSPITQDENQYFYSLGFIRDFR